MTLLEKLPNAQRRAIEIVRTVAREKSCRPYLVGGPVRDLLLGRAAIDLDLTLEEGASTLARALARQTQGRVRSYPQFLTYKVVAEDLPVMDIATARKERYRTPGALPTVTAGKLRDDLQRRDFSINAIALDLIDETLHDPTGGRLDIEQRLVRVLHEGSFVDDPTRVFRAERLAARLGFGFDPRTEELMEAAIASTALATVSRERLWRELFLAMDEREAPTVLARLARRGALDVLFGHRVTAGDESSLAAVAEELTREPAADRYVLYTGALLRGDASPIDLEGSGFSQKRARVVVEIANEIPRIRETLAAAGDDRRRFDVLRRLAPETLLALRAIEPGSADLVARFRRFADFRLPLRGNDLEVPAGPHIAHALERAREAVFHGEIAPEDARAFATEVARGLLSDGERSASGVLPAHEA